MTEADDDLDRYWPSPACSAELLESTAVDLNQPFTAFPASLKFCEILRNSMSRTTKQYQQLDALEASLCTALIKSLSSTLESGYCYAFDRPDTSKVWYPFALKSPKVRELNRLVDEIEALREKLGEPVNEGIVGRFRYWADHHFSDDPNRLGPKRIAEAFIEEIRKLEHNS